LWLLSHWRNKFLSACELTLNDLRAQTQFHPKSTHAVVSNDPDTQDHFGRPGIAPHAPPKQPTETTGPSLTHDNPGKSDRDAMQALLNVYGVTSGNYQDILKAA
jgi:hypothetical protein